MTLTGKDFVIVVLSFVVGMLSLAMLVRMQIDYAGVSRQVSRDEAETIMRLNERLVVINQLCVGVRNVGDGQSLIAEGVRYGQVGNEIAGTGPGMREFQAATGGPGPGR